MRKKKEKPKPHTYSPANAYQFPFELLVYRPDTINNFFLLLASEHILVALRVHFTEF